MRNIPYLPSLLGVALLLALSAGSVSAQTGPKIGYVNSAAIYAEVPGAEAAQAEFEQQMTAYREEVQRLGEELQAMVAEHQQQHESLSAEVREARETAIREKDGAYRQRVAQLENEAGRRQQQLVEPIMQQIRAVIETIRREGGYSMVFDVGPRSNVIAADPDLDLTNEVIRRLQAGGD